MQRRKIESRSCGILSTHLTAIGVVFILSVTPSYSQQGGSSTPHECSKADSAFGVTVASCAFTLAASPAGTPNYYVDVKIDYTAQAPDQAVRFRCEFSNGGTPATKIGVSRLSGSAMRFVTPFNPPIAAITVACAVDATTQHPA
jgi:hypothetical protein